MPIKLWIERDLRRIRADLSGVVSISEMLEAINASVEDPDYEAGFDVLSDHTGIDQPISTENVHHLVKHLQALTEHFEGTRWAIVTEKPASYGMMRMLSVFARRVPMNVRVFRSIAAAEAWLQSFTPSRSLQ